MSGRLPSKSGSTSKASSSFGSTESITTSDTASSVDVAAKAILSPSNNNNSNNNHNKQQSITTAATTTATSIPKSSLSLKLSSDSVDDFSIDETVWVNGSRAGIIRFIGETKFAAGKWIGVQLTSPDGKNDGTVGGVRYFACPPNCGVFVKPQRLTKAPMPESVFQKRLASPARSTIEKDLALGGGAYLHRNTDSDSSTDIGLATSLSSLKNSPFLSGSADRATAIAPIASTGSYGRISGFKIGDRVLVNASSGTKLGTLMFLGETDFAAGQWAGIELDEPVGKNDGSVAGKRYFDCKMKFGLFAPLHKISAAPLSALSKQQAAAAAAAAKKSSTTGLSSKTSSISKLASGGRMSRTGSQESVSSAASGASSIAGRSSRGGIRLGVTSLKSPITMQNNASSASSSSTTRIGSPTTATAASKAAATRNAIAGTNAAILDALKEKDEHIAQLLRERDLERGEFSRVAVQADEMEERVASLQAENARIATEADEEIGELKRLNSEYEEVQLKMSTQLDDERRKVEDLLFRFEEESLAKAELETLVGDLKRQVDEWKTKLMSSEIGSSNSISEDSVAEQKRQISEIKQECDDLRDRLRKADERLDEKENEIFALQEEMTRKDEAVFQHEASSEKRKAEFGGLQIRLREIEHELDVSNQRSQRHLETIDELNKRVSKAEAENAQMRTERTGLIDELREQESRVCTLESRLVSEVADVKRTSDQTTNKQIAKLEADLERKTRAEKALETRLAETNERHDRVEAEVNTLADQIRDLRRLNEEENRRRKCAEDKVAMLTANNQTLSAKIEDMIQKSGDNSDLLSKMNDELTARQAEFSRKERQAETEIESLLRDKESREADIRNLRIDIENQKSIISRFEKKERDIEKLIQANENELKLTRSDADEKRRQIDDLRAQLADAQQRVTASHKAADASKDELESQLGKLTRELNDARKEILTIDEEWRKCKDRIFELETDRDRAQRESDRLRAETEERDRTIDEVRLDAASVREKFADYQQKLAAESEQRKQSGAACDDLRAEIERIKAACRQAETENATLREENRALAAKTDELQEDIEGIKRRHAEVLNEFEIECKRAEARAEAAETAALDQTREQQQLEHRQNVALDEYRTAAAIEKRIMEQKLDDLEAKLREQSRQLQREQDRRVAEDMGSYEQQVEFLNSVIVDMQRKNDELRNRVQVLEEIGLGEFEHSFQSQVEHTAAAHRQHPTTTTTAAASTMTNGHIRNLRRYCDICEIFDAHDTEDCPQQTTTTADSDPDGTVRFREPGHTYNAIDPQQARPYCTLCERFGHALEQCPDNETF